MAVYDDVVTIMMLRYPFFASLLMEYKVVVVDKLNPPTLQVSAAKISIHRAFFNTLPDEEGVFALSHEIMHGIWGHLTRMKEYNRTGFGPDGKKYSHDRMNRAMDYVINDGLKKDGMKLIKSCLWEARFDVQMTPEEVYCILAKEEENQSPPQKPDKQDNSGAGDPGEGSGGGDESDEEGDESDEEGEGKPGDEDAPGKGGKGGDEPADDPGDAGFDSHDWESDEESAIGPVEIMNAVHASKGQGSLPAGCERLVELIKRPALSPWAVLRQEVSSAVKGEDTRSWRRLNRRLIHRGIGAPTSIQTGAGKVGVIIDVSGSIDQRMVNVFGSHVGAIIDDARPEVTTLYWVDTAVERVDVVKNGTELRRLLGAGFKAPGGGGTDMPKGVDAAIKAGCDCVVVLTDGYTPFGSPSKKKVIWAITDKYISAPHGRTLHIDI